MMGERRRRRLEHVAAYRGMNENLHAIRREGGFRQHVAAGRALASEGRVPGAHMRRSLMPVINSRRPSGSLKRS